MAIRRHNKRILTSGYALPLNDQLSYLNDIARSVGFFNGKRKMKTGMENKDKRDMCEFFTRVLLCFTTISCVCLRNGFTTKNSPIFGRFPRHYAEI